jgi:two-component system, cell cycle sensor histidine kinase and response regulator CckA
MELEEFPKTVLLVEADPAVSNWMHAQLEESGYNLLEASNAADSLLIAELHRGTIDLVVTDVMMPEANGQDPIAALLKLRPHVQILYTGNPEPLLRRTTTLHQSINYLQKPFAMTVLLERIKQLLESTPDK